MPFSALALIAPFVAGNDPASSWLTYAVYTAPHQNTVTMVNTTWVVPSEPATSHGSNAPGYAARASNPGFSMLAILLSPAFESLPDQLVVRRADGRW